MMSGATGEPPVRDQRQAFRDAFARWPSGVALISTMTTEGPVGMTGTSVISLSLDPLLVLASLDRRSSTLASIRAEKSFGISILRPQDRAVAAACAGELPSGRRFVGVPHEVRNGVPVLLDALAWVTCDLFETYPGGDHLIVVGSVTGVGGSDGPSLVWHDRGYRIL